MSKNTITLDNDRFGKHQMSLVDSSEIFRREDMSNTLQMIEDKEYSYDDITEIKIVNLMDIEEIIDLPYKLQVLSIELTTLERLTIPEYCKNIKVIEIKHSNLTYISDIDFLTNLHKLIIEHSHLTKIPEKYPSSLKSINFSNSRLTSSNNDIRKFPQNIPIILFNNSFVEKQMIDGYNIIYGTQRIYNISKIHKKITNYGIQNTEARNMIGDALNRRQYNPDEFNIVYNELFDPNAFDPDHFEDNDFMRNILNQNGNNAIHPQPPQINILNQNRNNAIHPQPPQINIFNSGQTVHISSICNSVTKSVLKITELTNYIYTISSKDVLINELIDEFYTWKAKTFLQRMYYLFGNQITNSIMVSNIRLWIGYPDRHTKTGITYGELLARVWILIKNHPQKEDFINNVKIELNSSVGVCFTGRFNRLVNSLIGFVDGVTVGISIKEQLQLEIGKLINKLGANKISYNDCHKKITELFEDPDVKEDETITSYYKQSWLDALDDYKPDSEEKKDTINEAIEELNN